MKQQGIALALGILSATAMAAPQDSVSKSAGLPGDAVNSYATSEQKNNYVVDLQSFTTSWGTQFGIAPVVKSGLSEDPSFFNLSISAQAASATLLPESATPSSSYSLWTNTPGVGVHPTQNNAPGSQSAPVQTSQVATAFAEFGTGPNHVVTALVNFNPIDPSRLFVSRIQAAVNGSSPLDNNAQLGFGSVDANGNTYIRADDFGVGGSNPITGNNVYRVDAAARNTAQLNQLLGSGPSDAGASEWLVQSSGTTHNPASNIPEDVAGRPILAGSNFSSQYLYEGTAGVVTATTTHLGSASDHRGNVFYSRHPVFGGSIGTAALYGQDGSGDTRLLKIWGVGANGAPVGNFTLTTPVSITDNDTGFNFPNDLSAYPGATMAEYSHYLSQAAFRGGNGQVAVGKDQAGRILVAAVGNADDPTTPNYSPVQLNPINAIFVARFNPANIAGTLQWTLAAYNDLPNGKPILNGPNGTPIGQIVQLDQFSGSAIGPSIAPPMIDSVGNIWFVAAIETFSPADFDTALIRAVYNPTSFSYELELVASVGDVFAGVNSGRDWQISFLPVADSNSISSSAAFSGNIVQTGFNDIDVSGLQTSDPATLGGLFLYASITYDYDDNGVFDSSLGSDQQYNSMIYVGVDQPECVSSAVNYCTAGTSASGCQAMISATGIASASAGEGFTVSVTNLEGNKDGIFFMAQNGRQANSWGNGTSFQCVVPPVKRGGLQVGQGTNGLCNGSASQDLNALWCELCPKPQRKPTVGVPLQIQFWYRDPNNTSNQTTSLSNALETTICP